MWAAPAAHAVGPLSVAAMPSVRAAGAGPMAVAAAPTAWDAPGAPAEERSLARTAAPRAALNRGCDVVTTGACRRSDRQLVISGIHAPPPTVAIAASRCAGI